jgi:hypothetical protein
VTGLHCGWPVTTEARVDPLTGAAVLVLGRSRAPAQKGMVTAHALITPDLDGGRWRVDYYGCSRRHTWLGHHTFPDLGQAARAAAAHTGGTPHTGPVPDHTTDGACCDRCCEAHDHTDPS